MFFESARQQMLDCQLIPMGVQDPRILGAMGSIPREEFVAPGYRELAYAESHLPLRAGQAIWSCSLIGQALQALAVTPQERVLEIGAGTGYVTTLFSHLAAQVFSIVSDWSLFELAKKQTQAYAQAPVVLQCMEGEAGWPAHSPYDVIYVGGACLHFPTALCQQLAVGGRLFVIIGQAPSMRAHLYTKTGLDSGHCVCLFEQVVVPYLPGITTPSTIHGLD